MKALATFCLLLSSCAHTTLYDLNGRKVAMIQGDITDVKICVKPDGSMTFEAETMDHSSPTLAQGRAGSIRAEGIGSAAAAVATGYLLAK